MSILQFRNKISHQMAFKCLSLQKKSHNILCDFIKFYSIYIIQLKQYNNIQVDHQTQQKRQYLGKILPFLLECLLHLLLLHLHRRTM